MGRGGTCEGAEPAKVDDDDDDDDDDEDDDDAIFCFGLGVE